MKHQSPQPITGRLWALILVIALALPNPALALRPTGLEESSSKNKSNFLSQLAASSAGQEERTHLLELGDSQSIYDRMVDIAQIVVGSSIFDQDAVTEFLLGDEPPVVILALDKVKVFYAPGDSLDQNQSGNDILIVWEQGSFDEREIAQYFRTIGADDPSLLPSVEGAIDFSFNFSSGMPAGSLTDIRVAEVIHHLDTGGDITLRIKYSKVAEIAERLPVVLALAARFIKKGYNPFSAGQEEKTQLPFNRRTALRTFGVLLGLPFLSEFTIAQNSVSPPKILTTLQLPPVPLPNSLMAQKAVRLATKTDSTFKDNSGAKLWVAGWPGDSVQPKPVIIPKGVNLVGEGDAAQVLEGNLTIGSGSIVANMTIRGDVTLTGGAQLLNSVVQGRVILAGDANQVRGNRIFGNTLYRENGKLQYSLGPAGPLVRIGTKEVASNGNVLEGNSIIAGVPPAEIGYHPTAYLKKQFPNDEQPQTSMGRSRKLELSAVHVVQGAQNKLRYNTIVSLESDAPAVLVGAWREYVLPDRGKVIGSVTLENNVAINIGKLDPDRIRPIVADREVVSGGNNLMISEQFIHTQAKVTDSDRAYGIAAGPTIEFRPEREMLFERANGAPKKSSFDLIGTQPGTYRLRKEFFDQNTPFGKFPEIGVFRQSSDQQAGQEEKTTPKPNMNLAGPAGLRPQFDKISALQGLSPARKDQLAQAIASERPFSGYKDSADLVARMRGQVSGVNTTQLQAIGNHFQPGMSRRGLLAIAFGVTLLAAVPVALWLFQPATAPEGHIVWVFEPHGANDLGVVFAELRAAAKSGQKTIYIRESVPFANFSQLNAEAPKLAQQLKPETIDPLLALYEQNGEEGLLKESALAREIKTLYEERQKDADIEIPQLRSDPSVLKDPPPGLDQNILLEAQLLVDYPNIEVRNEKASFIAYLYHIRSEWTNELAGRALFGDNDRDAYFRFMMDSFRYEALNIELRDRPFASFVESILRENPGATVVVQRGLYHVVSEYGIDYDTLKFRSIERRVEIDDSITKIAFFYHEQFLRGESVPVSDKMRRSMLENFIGDSVTRLLQEETSSAIAFREAASITGALSDQELDELIKFLGEDFVAFRENQKTAFFGAWNSQRDLTTLQWLQTHQKISAANFEILRPAINRRVNAGQEELGTVVIDQHQKPISAVAISSDGKTIASGDSAGRLIIKQVEGAPEPIIVNTGNVITDLVFDTSGGKIAVGYVNGAIAFYDPQTGKTFPEDVAQPTELGSLIWDMAFHREGHLTAISHPGLIHSIDPETGDIDRLFEGLVKFSTTPGIVRMAVAFPNNESSPKFAISGDSEVRVIEEGLSPREIDRFEAPGHVIQQLAIDPTGQYLVASNLEDNDDENWIQLRDINAHASITLNGVHRQRANAIAFSPDGKMLVSAGKDGQLVFWEVPSGRVIKIVSLDPMEGKIQPVPKRGDPSYVSSVIFHNVVFTPNGHSVLVAVEDQRSKQQTVRQFSVPAAGQEKDLPLDIRQWDIDQADVNGKPIEELALVKLPPEGLRLPHAAIPNEGVQIYLGIAGVHLSPEPAPWWSGFLFLKSAAKSLRLTQTVAHSDKGKILRQGGTPILLGLDPQQGASSQYAAGPFDPYLVSVAGVSRAHLLIRWDTNGDIVFKDLNSRNGTWIDRQAAEQIKVGSLAIPFVSAGQEEGITVAFPESVLQDAQRQGVTVFDAEQLAGYGIPGAHGILIADSANSKSSSGKIYADNELENRAAERVFTWVLAGDNAVDIIETAEINSAAAGDLIILRPETGLDNDRIKQLLEAQWINPSVRVVVGDASVVNGLSVNAFRLLAGGLDLPPVVFLNTTVRLNDEAGNTYTLILMA